MQEPNITQIYREKIAYPNLPLAVYREIAAHLGQVSGIQTQLIPQRSDRFDYSHSQIDHLELSYPQLLGESDRQHLEDILAFYGDRYGTPERTILT
jgi:hypothetical protein